MIPHRRIKQIYTIACSKFFSEESMAFACILGFSDADNLVALDNVGQLYAEHEHEPLSNLTKLALPVRSRQKFTSPMVSVRMASGSGGLGLNLGPFLV